MKGKKSSKCFTLLISFMLFNPFKMAVFQTASNFPNFNDPIAFSLIQQVPGPDFRKVGKSLLRPMEP